MVSVCPSLTSAGVGTPLGCCVPMMLSAGLGTPLTKSGLGSLAIVGGMVPPLSLVLGGGLESIPAPVALDNIMSVAASGSTNTGTGLNAWEEAGSGSV